jgi:predicted dehydrogenase
MLAREGPDAVGIFTPNALHCECALKAIASGEAGLRAIEVIEAAYRSSLSGGAIELPLR